MKGARMRFRRPAERQGPRPLLCPFLQLYFLSTALHTGRLALEVATPVLHDILHEFERLRSTVRRLLPLPQPPAPGILDHHAARPTQPPPTPSPPLAGAPR